MPRLLLIEDNQHIQRVYRDKFRHEGFEVVTADTGEQGLACARQCAADVILLDIMLPLLNGFEVLKSLRADPTVAMTPVFILTNRASTTDVQYALSLGAQQFYTKGSVTLQEIIQEICRHCGLRRLLITSPTAEAAHRLQSSLQHPQLLCSGVTVLAEIMTALGRCQPELVVLDARPPAPDAYAILQQLKANPATKVIPVVVIAYQARPLWRADAVVPPGRIDTELRPTVLGLLELDDLTVAAARRR